MQMREILFEGLTDEEILKMPQEVVQELILLGEPLVFRVGSATVLGSFKIDSRRLVIELAQIDGGGEGVLVSLGSLTRRFAQLRGLDAVEWIVHAVACAKPNLKLRHVLKRRGYVVETIPEIGEAYHRIDELKN